MRSGTGRISRPVNRRRNGIRFGDVVLVVRLLEALRMQNAEDSLLDPQYDAN